MNKQDEMLKTERFAEQPEQAEQAQTMKQPFVEPEISAPVDVLEVTTFQTVVDSGRQS